MLLRLLVLSVVFSSSLASAQDDSAPPDLGVENLRAATAQNADVAALAAVLEGTPEPAVREWLGGVASAADDCDAPALNTAMQASLEDAAQDELVSRIGGIFEGAPPALYSCLAADVERELALSAPGDRGYEALIAGIQSSGIFDAGDDAPASDALVRQLLDELLPSVATTALPANPPPVLNALEPERSPDDEDPFDPNTGGGVIIDPNQPEPPVSGS